ncbi:MAG: DUF2490 domain-containing protein [Chitinophagaceae bacterium]|jgi:hypothetical protein
MNCVKYFFFIIFFSCVVIGSQAQATRSDPVDGQGWYGAGMEFNLPKKWGAELSYQSRFYNDLKTYYGSYLSLSVEKGLSKSFYLLGAYRLSMLTKGTYNRFTGGFVVKKKFEEVKSDLRVIYQNQVQDFDDPAKEDDRDNFVRIRLRARKSLSDRIGVLASAEPIYQIANGVQIDNYRFQAGLRYSFTKQASLDVFYINRPDYAKSYKRQYHILGVAFNYELKID